MKGMMFWSFWRQKSSHRTCFLSSELQPLWGYCRRGVMKIATHFQANNATTATLFRDRYMVRYAWLYHDRHIFLIDMKVSHCQPSFDLALIPPLWMLIPPRWFTAIHWFLVPRQLFDRMYSQRLAPTTVTYNALINAHVRRMPAAEDLDLKRVKFLVKLPRTQMYNHFFPSLYVCQSRNM